MNNSRITPKERNLLKGAVRRVFSRSEIRKKVLDTSEINYKDPNRPRVTKWVTCQTCNQPTPKYLAQVDHIVPIVPTNSTLEDMSWDTVIDRTWCEEKNLATICKPCHKIKSKEENKLRRTNKLAKLGLTKKGKK